MRCWQAVLTASLLASSAMAQVRRIGNEFQVNTYTDYYQSRLAVAADGDGDFVVAWSSIEDGSSTGIFAQRFSSAGLPLGVEFQVNTYTAGYQSVPAVAASAAGDFIVAWRSLGQDGEAYGIFARRFSSAGVALASEFQVNTYTSGQQRFAAVAADTDGDFVVAWESYGQDGDRDGIFVRRFSSAGAPLTGELQANLYTVLSQRDPTVASDGNGDFVVAWDSFFQDKDGYGVFARRFSSAGVGLGGELQVNTYTPGAQSQPRLAVAGNGDFVVTWESNLQDGDQFGVLARRFSSAGVGLTGELQVNSYVTGNQHYPSIATAAGGDFVVVWTSDGQDGSSSGVFARLFSSAGVASGGEFQVNSYTSAAQTFAAVAAQAGGDFVVAWSSTDQDGSYIGGFAQRFGGPIPLDVDGNGGLTALTDGVLVLRFLFGFTGSTLTGGAVGGGCTRCDASTIAPYLTSLGLVLDIDGNGSLGALTDGLLALRFLFGFTGTTLTGGAVGGGCTRCDAAAIVPYLAGLTS